MCPVQDPSDIVQYVIDKQKKGPVLTAKDYVARLMCNMPNIHMLAKRKKKTELIRQLRGFRADTSWLIHQIEQGKCKC